MGRAIWLLFLFADLVKAPATLSPYSGSSNVFSKNGSVHWTADWALEPIEVEGKKAVRVTEHGSGRISGFSQDVRWSIEATWRAEGGFRPLDVEKTITAADGKPLLVERKHFDPVKGVVRFERQPTNGQPETKILSVPADTLAVEGIAGVLRFLQPNEARPFSAHLLSNEPKLYSVTFELRGKERVKTPAGDFECYKLELVPHLGLLNTFRYFFPKTFFWYTVAPPHDWVRYEGLENGPGTPQIVMELSRRGR
ncbi:MAG TPA: DUF3108 domain-containing protein [Terriglobia bacterium]|nr:DUF3108 domain-containing protein [Terriglobia bacterium]